ncbi:Ubiquitin-like domain-containing CTD phosphatase 1 [Clonorchis sinensis]|uniref:Ubiquitin-like domain-containing CTD phosphatase 1 n=1 Tax=Clonorchis sinensis TaxID=79923 RepID=A0A8T1MP71_CLOSI|nr:Ubiquitin-like domain-containing CTD phosphatase 1 [Clonorchis sinensis]
MPGDSQLVIQIKFNGQPLVVDSLGPEHTLGDLKQALFKQTRVLAETQKLLGLRACNNAPVDDSTLLSQLVLKPSTKIMLIGSTQEAIEDVNRIADSPTDVVDDFEIRDEDIQLCDLPENLEKVVRRSKSYKPRKLCEPRLGKRLLVLDVDYTIFDHLTPAENARQLARPYLFEFLKRAYVHYDIAIWSATSMTWILAKLGQLGIIPANAASILRNQTTDVSVTSQTPAPDTLQLSSESQQAPFRISLLLDATDMISVHFSSHGVKEVKPLAVIWKNHPQWGPHNTIMFDDVRRNFIMNPQSGLRIRPYRDAHVNRTKDRELRGLALYLELIAAREKDFTVLHHNRWEKYVSKYKRTINRNPATENLQLESGLHVSEDSTSLSFMQGVQVGTESTDTADSTDAEMLNPTATPEVQPSDLSKPELP